MKTKDPEVIWFHPVYENFSNKSIFKGRVQPLKTKKKVVLHLSSLQSCLDLGL